MKKKRLWYERDTLWESLEGIMFNQQRLTNAPAEVENMIKLLDITASSRVLDLCCGIGRHTLEFARRGFAITGVDRTAAYLKKAKTRRAGTPGY